GWFVLAVLLFFRRGWLRWSLRLGGWFLLLPAAAVLADLLGPERVGGPVTGGGGSVGAWLALALRSQLGPVGGLLLLAAALLTGLTLAADVVLLRLLVVLWGAVRRLLLLAWHLFGRAWRVARP